MNQIMNTILEQVELINGFITFGMALKLMGCALGLSVVIMLVYMFTHRRTGFRPAMLFTMMLLGPAVSIIVICIGSNIARAISSAELCV